MNCPGPYRANDRWKVPARTITAVVDDYDWFVNTEDQVVQRYVLLDKATKRNVHRQWPYEEGACCPLFDPSKHQLRHHRVHAVAKLLALPAFVHLQDISPWRLWECVKSQAPDVRCRRFVNLYQVARELTEEFGLYCQGCEQVIQVAIKTYHDYLVDESRCTGIHSGRGGCSGSVGNVPRKH